jgi:hypothetical protein
MLAGRVALTTGLRVVESSRQGLGAREHARENSASSRLNGCRAMRNILRARVPPLVLWTLAGLLVAGCVGSYELATRPYNGIRVGSLQSEARSALPVGSSREQVVAWLDARGLPYEPVYDKGGERFLWYLVRMPNGSWMQPNAGLWMTFNFDAAERLSGVSAGQD